MPATIFIFQKTLIRLYVKVLWAKEMLYLFYILFKRFVSLKILILAAGFSWDDKGPIYKIVSYVG